MASKGKTQPVPASKQINLVHKDIIHGETIRKEMKFADRNIMKNFQLNPHTIHLMAEKPNTVNPSKRRKELLEAQLNGGFTEDPVEEAFSNEKLEKNLKAKDRVPRQKFQVPLTSNQEIGWFTNQMARPKSCKDHKLKSNEITKFANDYYELKKINPFKVR